MRKLASFIALAIPCFFHFACGDDAEETSDALVEACEKYCDASFSLDCGQPLTAEQCRAGCPGYEDQIFGLCIKEETDTLNCASGLKFTCMNEIPVPEPTGCLSESQALSTCKQEAPCKTFCAAAVKAGCGGASEAECITKCKDDAAAFSFCTFDYNRLLACQGQKGVTCENGVPRSASCEEEALDVADCVAFDDPCLGHCLAAELAGCGGESRDACTADCQAKITAAPQCEFDFEQLLECDAREGVACEGSTAKSKPDCSFEEDSYSSCAGGMTP